MLRLLSCALVFCLIPNQALTQEPEGALIVVVADLEEDAQEGPLAKEELSIILRKAAYHVGVDPKWADDPWLHRIIELESGRDPGARNQHSSAFGLFQMVRSTWEQFLPEVPVATEDPFWQAVGGLRYLQRVYRSPERAHRFLSATLSSRADLAPADLQVRAELWIARGYRGY